MRLLAVCALLGGSAAEAAWPDRPVTIVVPFAAGGIVDVNARFVADW